MGPDETASLTRPKCPNCDTVGVPGARFCSNCGNRLDQSVVADATGALPPASGEEMPTGPTPIVADVPESSAVLVIRKGPDTGARYLLNKDVVTVGRSPDSDVFLDDVTVSRNHAEFLHGASGWLLRDKKSLNGTYVNRVLVDEARLTPGDEVQLGKFNFMFWAAE